MDAPIIYNLFPRLVGQMERWHRHATRAREMAFDWIFINPIQYPGFSGSLYAVKDHYSLNPLFIGGEAKDPMQALRRTLEAMHRQGLSVMMDLVINHTAKDSPLVREHPQWYRRDSEGAVVSPSAIDPADARRVTVWGDLAEVDNTSSTDRAGLWAYWTAMVQYYLELGIDGFRCDAAYKVPCRLWEHLIGIARKKRPGTVFAAETLGCRLAEVEQLRGSGFDYLFNSSKWWNFEDPWCLEQHEDQQEIAPSIAFPESHDTPRLMSETGGKIQVQKQRYLFAALFSEGLLMPIGYELGFIKKLDVVNTSPDDWEETGVDLSAFIRAANRVKRDIPVFGCEGHFRALTPYDQPTAALLKHGDGVAPAVIVVNKDWSSPQTVDLTPLVEHLHRPPRVLRIFRGEGATPTPADGKLELDPAEIVIL